MLWNANAPCNSLTLAPQCTAYENCIVRPLVWGSLRLAPIICRTSFRKCKLTLLTRTLRTPRSCADGISKRTLGQRVKVLYFFFFSFFFSLMIYAMYAKGRAVSNLMLSEELAQEYKTRQVGTRQDKTNNYRPSDQQGTRQDKTNNYRPSDQQGTRQDKTNNYRPSDQQQGRI